MVQNGRKVTYYDTIMAKYVQPEPEGFIERLWAYLKVKQLLDRRTFLIYKSSFLTWIKSYYTIYMYNIFPVLYTNIPSCSCWIICTQGYGKTEKISIDYIKLYIILY